MHMAPLQMLLFSAWINSKKPNIKQPSRISRLVCFQSSDTVIVPLALVDAVGNKAGVQQLPPSLEPRGQARFLLFQSQFYYCSRDYSFFFF